MSIYALMEEVRELLVGRVEGVKAIYGPGVPAGPYAQNLPAVIVDCGSPAEKRTYFSEDLVEHRYAIEVHVLTRDPLERQEQRARGSYGTLYPLLEKIAKLLHEQRGLGGVDELAALEIYSYGPAHGWVAVEYLVYDRR